MSCLTVAIGTSASEASVVSEGSAASQASVVSKGSVASLCTAEDQFLLRSTTLHYEVHLRTTDWSFVVRRNTFVWISSAF